MAHGIHGSQAPEFQGEARKPGVRTGKSNRPCPTDSIRFLVSWLPLKLSCQPSLKLALTLKTALTIATAMKPTMTNTASSTTVAMTFTKRFSWLEMMR